MGKLFSASFWKAFCSKSVQITSNTVKAGRSAIKIEKIKKTYYGIPTVHALNKVSFKVKAGEVIILIGPNGCGKSTLINSMTGSIIADSGKITIFGKPATFRDMQRFIGICFQDNIFFPKMSVYKHLVLFGKIRGATQQQIEEQIDLFTEQLELDTCLRSKAKDLSGGQKRKLCIALAFIGSPAFVILDEPTAGIDASARQTIWKTISTFHKTTSFISSHALEEAESVCSRLFAMSEGRLVFQGTPNHLREQYHCGYIFHPVGESCDYNAILNFIKGYMPDSMIDPERADQIRMPMSRDIARMLTDMRPHLSEFRVDSYTIISEAIEDVLLRLISNS